MLPTVSTRELTLYTFKINVQLISKEVPIIVISTHKYGILKYVSYLHIYVYMHTYIYIIYIIDQVFINIKFLEKRVMIMIIL